jgi:hypothetical protein
MRTGIENLAANFAALLANVAAMPRDLPELRA